MHEVSECQFLVFIIKPGLSDSNYYSDFFKSRTARLLNWLALTTHQGARMLTSTSALLSNWHFAVSVVAMDFSFVVWFFVGFLALFYSYLMILFTQSRSSPELSFLVRPFSFKILLTWGEFLFKSVRVIVPGIITYSLHDV